MEGTCPTMSYEALTRSEIILEFLFDETSSN